jgi:Type IV leader peptidase family
VNDLTAIGLGLAGTLAGVPVAAIAYAVPAEGRVRVPAGWWRGAPAPRTAVAATSILTGGAAVIVAVWLPASPALPAFWFFAVVGIGLAIIDVRRSRLPHGLTGSLWIACLLCFTITVGTSGDIGPLVRALVAGSAATAALMSVALVLPGQLGLGDVAFAGAISLSLGWASWQSAAIGVLSGLLLQGITGLVIKARRRGDGVMPMGPALIAGWLLAVVLGVQTGTVPG